MNQPNIPNVFICKCTSQVALIISEILTKTSEITDIACC